jgi:Tol biopolymer transport system component
MASLRLALVLLPCIWIGATAAQPAEPNSGSLLARNGELVFSSIRAKNGPVDLYLMRPDGSKLRRITRGPAQERYPKWSPDGRRLAFISDRTKPRNEGASEIYVMNANGSGLRRVTRDRWVDDQIAWAPDGKRFVFSSSRGSGYFSLWVMNANGSGGRRLTREGGVPAWSPDGKTIVFSRYNPGAGTSGIDELWLINPDGSNERQLTFPPQHEEISSLNGHDSMPVWSPDGTQLAFARQYRGRTDIYLIGADGTGMRRLTSDTGFHIWPAWSPDGKRIAYVRGLRPRREIVVMNADGTQKKRVAGGALSYDFLDWQSRP